MLEDLRKKRADNQQLISHNHPEDFQKEGTANPSPCSAVASAAAREVIINSVESSQQLIQGKITIDSGAADSVIPYESLKGVFPLLLRQEGVKFSAANGSPLQNYGKMDVAFKAKGREGINCMSFHATDVKKPLASVRKIVEEGSSVHFIPFGSYIQGVNGERVNLQVEGGVYVSDIMTSPDVVP